MGTDPPPEVAEKFRAFSPGNAKIAQALRRLILSTAQATPGVGQVTETLKWGQPSYLTSASKSGTTIRITETNSGELGLFFHCQTTVVSDFRTLFPIDFTYDGNRGVMVSRENLQRSDSLALLISGALTYHLKRE